MADTPTHYFRDRLVTWRRRPLFLRIEIGRWQMCLSDTADCLMLTFMLWSKEHMGGG